MGFGDFFKKLLGKGDGGSSTPPAQPQPAGQDPQVPMTPAPATPQPATPVAPATPTPTQG